MFFQLSQIQKQEALIQNFQQTRQNTYEKLIRSYSSKQRNKNSLKQNFQTILKQSALLIHILRQIQQSIQHKKLLPTIFNEKDLNKLLYSTTELPQWFEHVFCKEYEKQKINLQTIGNKVYKLHGLNEKNSQLVKQHWNMEILLKRYESLNEKETQNLDIVAEIESFQNICKNCKQIYKNFLQMMTKKVVQFLENTVQSTLLYSNQLKKVKSFDNLHISNVITSKNQQSGIFLPIKIINDTSNLQSRNTIKICQDKQLKNISSDYRIKDQVNNNNSTVQSLRQKEKANNQYFFRQARNLDKFSDYSLTKNIKSIRSQNIQRQQPLYCQRYQPHIRQKSNDFSIRSAKSFNDESIGLKTYKSSGNINYQPYTSRVNRDYSPKQIQTNREIKPNQIKKSNKSIECLHHCPHHDKPLNNHCSKHCNKLCVHEKQYFNDFGLDLTQMNRQYFVNQQKYKKQTLKSTRSAENLQKQNYSSRQTNLSPYYQGRDRNIAQNSKYLRNSHDKHSDYYQTRNSNSFSKQNIKYHGNKPTITNMKHLADYQRLKYAKNIQFQQYQSSKNQRYPQRNNTSQYYLY